MEIHVHSTLAKEYNGRKVIPTKTNKGTHICTSHTRNIKIGLRDTRMPSLENWGGGLKSLLWLANSPHTSKCSKIDKHHMKQPHGLKNDIDFKINICSPKA